MGSSAAVSTDKNLVHNSVEGENKPAPKAKADPAPAKLPAKLQSKAQKLFSKEEKARQKEKAKDEKREVECRPLAALHNNLIISVTHSKS